MVRKIGMFLLAFAGVCASSVLASAQATSSSTEDVDFTRAISSPVAYVYVASQPTNNGVDQVNAYAASSNGALTAIPGSPFKYNVSALALNGAWLFAVDGTAQNTLDSFRIAANGSIALKAQYNTDASNGWPYDLFLDHTGATLYADYYTINNDYQSQSIDQSTGQLAFINDLSGGPENGSEMSFIGNNQYAYSSSCYHFSPDIFGVQRASDGALTWLSLNPPFPPEKNGGFYCPWLAAADPTNHLAVAMEPLNSGWGQDGNWQLAVYTVDSSGNLSTTSTWENMPSVGVGLVDNYSISPDGKFLAVSGASGLQVFHFNGANPITRFTGLMIKNALEQVYWDNMDHLYAVSREAGKLYVFTVTSTSVAQAPGSPHAIASPQSLIVLPKR